MFDFSNDRVLNSNCHKVQYTDYYLTELGSYCNYFIKSRQWEHEQEWRIVCETESEFLPYNKEVAIILGAKNTISTEIKYYELAWRHKLDLYRIEISPNSYNLNLKKVLSKGEYL